MDKKGSYCNRTNTALFIDSFFDDGLSFVFSSKISDSDRICSGTFLCMDKQSAVFGRIAECAAAYGMAALGRRCFFTHMVMERKI